MGSGRGRILARDLEGGFYGKKGNTGVRGGGAVNFRFFIER